jgi:hypothetical protein
MFSSNSDLHSLTFSPSLSNFSCYIHLLGAYEKKFASNFQIYMPATCPIHIHSPFQLLLCSFIIVLLFIANFLSFLNDAG